jgi:chromosome segregation ATPase
MIRWVGCFIYDLSSSQSHLRLACQINDALGPLKSKLRQKETDKQRSREAYSSDEQSLVSGLSNFTSEVARLYELGTTIESYAQSDGPTSLERVEAELLDVAEKSSSLKEKLQQLQPEIARARGTLKNQEREKAQLEFNISILQDQERIDGLREEISKKDVELNKIEGYKTAAAKQAKAKARKEELQAQKAQLEGRYSEIVERIRSLKVSGIVALTVRYSMVSFSDKLVSSASSCRPSTKTFLSNTELRPSRRRRRRSRRRT